MIYWIAHCLFTLCSKLCFPVKVYGRKYIPSHGGFIIASNHLSNLDPMILGIASSKKLSYMAKEPLFKNKFFAFFLREFGAFPIKRESLDILAVKEALKRLKRQGTVVFPEGTRKPNQDGKKNIQSGIGFLAVKSGVTVIPAFIDGTDKVMPSGSKSIKPGHSVKVYFGPGMIFASKEPYEQIAQRIMQQIYSLPPGV